jgi:hypothetical protein
MMLGRKRSTPHLVKGAGLLLPLLLAEALAAPFPAAAAMLARRVL